VDDAEVRFLKLLQDTMGVALRLDTAVALDSGAACVQALQAAPPTLEALHRALDDAVLGGRLQAAEVLLQHCGGAAGAARWLYETLPTTTQRCCNTWSACWTRTRRSRPSATPAPLFSRSRFEFATTRVATGAPSERSREPRKPKVMRISNVSVPSYRRPPHSATSFEILVHAGACLRRRILLGELSV